MELLYVMNILAFGSVWERRYFFVHTIHVYATGLIICDQLTVKFISTEHYRLGLTNPHRHTHIQGQLGILGLVTVQSSEPLPDNHIL